MADGCSSWTCRSAHSNVTYFQGGVRRRGLLPVTGRVARLTWALLIMSITCGALPALGQTPEADQANAIYAEFWDRFATTTVGDLPAEAIQSLYEILSSRCS